MTKGTERITALYERLPKDDEMQGDSNSIVNQMKLREKYAAENGFPEALQRKDNTFIVFPENERRKRYNLIITAAIFIITDKMTKIKLDSDETQKYIAVESIYSK